MLTMLSYFILNVCPVFNGLSQVSLHTVRKESRNFNTIPARNFPSNIYEAKYIWHETKAFKVLTAISNEPFKNLLSLNTWQESEAEICNGTIKMLRTNSVLNQNFIIITAIHLVL
jgi:hypothetical protein